MNLRIISALLAFLKEMVIDNDRVKLFAKKERNEFTLLLALAFIFGSFFWYYTESNRLWYTNRELTHRLHHQTIFIENLTSDRDEKLGDVTLSCQTRIDELVKSIDKRDVRIRALEDRKENLNDRLYDALQRCK